MRSFLFCVFIFPVSLFAQNDAQIKAYIEKFKDVAIEEMINYKIPASITLAQGIHESGAGTSVLAKNSNNHFGIKCHKDWEGKGYHHDDDAPKECFRVYENPFESYKDHSMFLTTRGWYKPLFALDVTDYKGWAHGLKKAGYATNPKYAPLLIDLIEKYELNKYDNSNLGNMNSNSALATEAPSTITSSVVSSKPEMTMQQGCGFVKVIINDVLAVNKKDNLSIDQLCKCANITPGQLYLFNDVDAKYNFKKDELVYLAPKKTVCDYDEYVPDEKTNFRDIAQRFGIQLSALLRFNQENDNRDVRRGENIRLSENKKPGKLKDLSGLVYTVKKGDSLYSIANNYQTTVDQIKDLNNLEHNGLNIGQQLKIK